MANRTILTWPNPGLNKKSIPVTDFNDELLSLVQDMVETMDINFGVGLAAPQIGNLSRVVAINCSAAEIENPDPYDGNENLLILVNPVLELSGGDHRWEEACLSVPGYSALVTRKLETLVTYQSVSGEKKTIQALWPLGGIIQHEADHLDGLLFLNRTSQWERQRIQKKILKLRKRKLKLAAEMKRRRRLELRGIDPDDPRQTHGPGKKKKRKKVKKNRRPKKGKKK